MKKNNKIKVKTLDENERMVITNPEKIALIESLFDQLDEMEVSPEKSKEIEEYSDMLPPLIEVGTSRSRILLNPVSTS